MDSTSKTEHVWSYERHKAHEAIMAKESNQPSCYTAPDCIDAWRHRRMHRMCEPLLAMWPQSKWMTVGDGRFGSDAHYFKSQGIDVLATSLTDESLKLAHEKGFIDCFAAINAEKIDLHDNSVDFAYCKEAYHHFPKPPIAFYEMLRVASKGVVLVEPNEERRRPLGWLKAIAKKKLWNQPLHFEPCGNFIYRTNPKEMARLMSADGCEGAIAYKLFNDFYHPVLAKQKSTPASIGFLLQRAVISAQNLLCHLGLMDYALICLVALKSPPDNPLQEKLKQHGFKVISLPTNPYKD